MPKNLTKDEFFEKYKNPLWQRKRLQIMEKNNFECEDCGSKEKTLNVHHSYYLKNVMPWEYPDNSLHCLCEDCHKEAKKIKEKLLLELGNCVQSDLERIIGYCKGLQLFQELIECVEVESHEDAVGIGDVFEINPDKIIECCQENNHLITKSDIKILRIKKESN